MPPNMNPGNMVTVTIQNSGTIGSTFIMLAGYPASQVE